MPALEPALGDPDTDTDADVSRRSVAEADVSRRSVAEADPGAVPRRADPVDPQYSGR